MFTDQEIAFLMKPHRVETADRRSHSLAASVDIRQIGCPPNIFNRVLEDRARKLGPKFAEFRSQQVAARTDITPSDNLDARIAASSLF